MIRNREETKKELASLEGGRYPLYAGDSSISGYNSDPRSRAMSMESTVDAAAGAVPMDPDAFDPNDFSSWNSAFSRIAARGAQNLQSKCQCQYFYKK